MIKGLSRGGLTSLLIAVFRERREGLCSEQDCRTVATYLIRLLTSHDKYVSGRKFKVFCSEEAYKLRPSISATEVDHAIPVKCLVDRMLLQPNDTDVALELERGYYLVRLTKEEHKGLVHKDSMPAGWETVPEDKVWMLRYQTVGNDPQINLMKGWIDMDWK